MFTERLKAFCGNTLARNTCVLLLFCALITLFYANRVFLTGANFGEDLLEQDIPHASFFIKTVKQGGLPLWNPYKVCGLPFFEVPFMGPYYPFVFLYFLLPIGKAVNCGFLVHILFSGIGMFVLCRELTGTSRISFFGAFTWMLSSIFQQYSESGWLTETIAASYLPLLVYVVIRITRSGRVRQVMLSLFAGWCVALVITGGKPDYAAVTLYSFLIFSIPLLRQKGLVSCLFLILSAGFLMSVVTWGPMLIQATEYHAWPEKIAANGYRLHEVMNFMVPVSLRRGFVGRLVFVLGIAGAFRRKTPFRMSFLLLSLFSLFFMFGDITMGSITVSNPLPFANQIGVPWIWHTGLIFSLVLFSCVSLNALRLKMAAKKGLFILILCLCIGVQLTDLYSFNRRFYPRRFDYTLEEYFPERPLVDAMKKDPALFRICNRFYDFSLLRVNQGMMEDIGCFESRVRGVNLYKVTGTSLLSDYLRQCPLPGVTDLCNAKYIVTSQDLPAGHFRRKLTTKDANERDVYLYENTSSFPRAFLLAGVGREEAEDLLSYEYRGGLLQFTIPDHTQSALSRYDDVAIAWRPNTYTVSLETGSESFLFLSEMYENGWKAFLDGSPVTIVSPFNFFMGISVPPGKHEVIFRFAPSYFYLFAAVSALTFLFTFFGIARLTAISRTRRK